MDAEHEGIAQSEGMKLPEDRFNGLTSVLEVAEGARVILIHNLAVEYGLMNGTQGIIKEIVYAPGSNPNHVERARRMPTAIVVDFPKYEGPIFFNDEARAT